MLICLSAPAAAQGLDETIDQAFSPVAKALSELVFYKIPIGDAELQLIVVWLVAAFSNEAGIGSSSIAHAAAKTREPISRGYVAMLEPFIDTVIVCATTALLDVHSAVGRASRVCRPPAAEKKGHPVEAPLFIYWW